MQILKNQIAALVSEAAEKLFAPATLAAEDVKDMLEYPADSAMGDIALPCFKLSRSLRRSPVQIAASLCERVNGGCIEKVEAVGGYLNLTEAIRLKAYGEEKAEDWLENFKLTHGKAPGRNDLCSCGSGKKYKFCCIDKQ